MRLARGAAWLGLVALLELIARAIVYGLAPSPAARMSGLEGRLGGPGFVTVLLVALGLAGLLSTLLVWLASLGVNERWALAERPTGGPRPRISVRRLLLRATALTLAGWLCFAAVESIVHLQAGMGFHGLTCLVGPVHRNALPVVGALALLASAVVSVAQLVLAWMRRTVARFGAARPTFRQHPGTLVLIVAGRVRPAPLDRIAPARGPPLPVA